MIHLRVLNPGMAEACQLMQEDGLTFDEALLQYVPSQLVLFVVFFFSPELYVKIF